MKKNLLTQLIMMIFMMVFSPQSMWADDYTITPLRGTDGYEDTEGYAAVLDGNPDTKWCSDDNAYVIFRVSTKCKITKYTLIDGADTEEHWGRHWDSWTIYGANFSSDDAATSDASGWEQITSQSNQFFGYYWGYQWEFNRKIYSNYDDIKNQSYTVDNAGAYLYYMIKVTGVYATDTGDEDDYEECVQQMADVNFTFENGCDHKNTDGTSALTSVTHDATCTTGAYTVQTCSICNSATTTYDTEHPALGHSFGSDGKCTRNGCSETATVSFAEDVASGKTIGLCESTKLGVVTNPSESHLTWESSDENVATVDENGNVTSHTAGTADITVTVTGTNISATCKVTVLNYICLATSYKITKELKAGESIKIYDDGGPDGNYSSYGCEGEFTAPQGYVIRITGTMIADGAHGDYLLFEDSGKEFYAECDDDGNPLSVNIDYTSNSNSCYINFEPNYTDGTLYSGLNLTATAVEYIGNLSFDDAAAYTRTTQAAVGNLKYTRSYTGNWQALYVPFSLDVDALKADYDIAYIIGVRQEDTDNDGTIDYQCMDVGYMPSASKTKANYPYLIRKKTAEDDATITLTDVTIEPAVSKSLVCSTILNNYTITGSYAETAADAMNNKYAMGNGGSLVLCDGTSSLKAQRWAVGVESCDDAPYTITGSGAAPAKSMFIHLIGDEEDTATGIHTVDNERQTTNNCYNVAGQRVKANAKGLVIKNGRKYFNN